MHHDDHGLSEQGSLLPEEHPEHPRGHKWLPDQPELYGTRDTSVADGYAELLKREPWHWFATLTFSPAKTIYDKYTGDLKQVPRYHPLHGMHLEAADKAWRWWIFEVNKTLYGNNWRRIPHGGVVWARGQEFHKSGKVHFHGVIAAPDCDLNSVARRDQAWRHWFEQFGRARIEPPLSQDDVVGYVSKYVTKDGEVDISRNFGEQRPYQIFDAGQMRQTGKPPQKPVFAGDQDRRGQAEKGRPRGSSPSLTLSVRPQFVLIDRTKETETRRQLTTESEET